MQEFSNIFFRLCFFAIVQIHHFFQTKQNIEDLSLNLILVVDVWSKITVPPFDHTGHFILLQCFSPVWWSSGNKSATSRVRMHATSPIS